MKNNGGGHLNHDLFWSVDGARAAQRAPRGALGEALDEDFGSFEAFRKKFSDVGRANISRAAGWRWRWITLAQKLEIVDLKDHEVLHGQRSTAS